MFQITVTCVLIQIFVFSNENMHLAFGNWWAGQRSRYSDWLGAGRFGDRIPVEARFSEPVQTGPGAHPASCTMGTGSFPGGKERPEREAEPSPPSSAVVKKGQSYTFTPPMGRTACTEPQCLYKGALYLFLFGTLCMLHLRRAATGERTQL